ncbi:MAG: YkgJ family cysteine cluster protein [Firmicutes bacterium]|nr:YkgJ family cysteine cluster protein [Bacillota bacterium]
MEAEMLRLYERMNAEAAEGFLCEGCGAECCFFELSGHLPFLTRPEWNLILNHTGGELPPSQVLVCPFLDQKTSSCSIYQVRPFRCRLYYCSRYPGINLPFNQYSARLHPFLEEYRKLTRGQPDWSIVELLFEE